MTLMDLVASLKMDVSQFISGTNQAKESAGVFSQGLQQAMAASEGSVKALDDAFSTLGIESSKAMKQAAVEAGIAFDTIKESGTASAGDIQRAEQAATEARIAYQKSLVQSMDAVNKAVEEQGKAIEEFGKKVTDAGKALTATFSVPLAAIGAIGLKAGTDLDDAFDKIRIKTGETGASLEGLQTSFRTVFGGVASSAGDVSTAIAVLHQRTGETGPALEEMATQAVNLARITGESLGPAIENASKAFNKWDIGVSSQGQTMDFLFSVTQKTGISFTDLTGTLTQSEAPLKALGLSFQDSAALVGLFNQQGFNGNEILGALKASLGKFAKAGQDPAEAFAQLMDSIRNTDDEAARFMATQVVGARRATEFAEAIRSGKLNFEELSASLVAGGDSINKAAKETDDFAEAWTKFKNNMVLALEPLGKTLFDVLNALTPHLQAVVAVVADVDAKFNTLDPTVRTMTVGIAALFAIVGPLTMGLGALAAQIPSMSAGLAAMGLSFAGVATAAAAAAAGVALVATGSALSHWASAENDLVRTTENLRRQTGDLELMATQLGVSVDRGNMSLEQYNLELNKAIRSTPDYQQKLAALKDAQDDKARSETEARKVTEDHARQMLDAALAAQRLADAHKALEHDVSVAKAGLQSAFDAYRKGTGDVAAVEAAMENLQAAQEALHPEKAAEEFVKARLQERAAAEANMKWYEDTYLPRWAAMTEQISVQDFKMQEAFFKAHEAMKAQALTPVVITVELDKRLPEEIIAMQQFMKAVADAYKTLGITSTATIEEHAKQAQIAYETIKNSGVASANDVLKSERAALQEWINAQQAAGLDVSKDVKQRLYDLNQQLDTHVQGQKTIWQDLANSVNRIMVTASSDLDLLWGQTLGAMLSTAQQLNTNMGKAFVDLFEGKGWKSFGDAGIKALEDIGAKTISFVLEYLEGKLIKSLASMFAENGVLDGLKAAFSGLWDFVKEGFSKMASLIWDGISAIGGAIKGLFSGGGAVSSAVDAVSGGAGAAGSAGSTASTVASTATSSIAGIVSAVGSIAGAISGIIGNFQMHGMTVDLGRIEESTRYAKGYLLQLNNDADRYWPLLNNTIQLLRLEGIENAINDVASQTQNLHSDIVVDLKNIIIELKDAVHEQIFKVLDTNATLGRIENLLMMIAGNTGSMAIDAGTTAQNSEQFNTTHLEQLIGTETSTFQNSLMNLSNSMLGSSGFSGLASSLNRLDIGGSITNALSGVTSGITSALYNLDDRGTLGTGLANISSMLSTLNNTLYNTRVAQVTPTPAVTYNYTTVTGLSAQQLASQLATQGVKF